VSAYCTNYTTAQCEMNFIALNEFVSQGSQ